MRDRLTLDGDETDVTPGMLAAASEVLMSFYMGDGVYDLREPCLAALYKAMREADRYYGANAQSAGSQRACGGAICVRGLAPSPT